MPDITQLAHLPWWLALALLLGAGMAWVIKLFSSPITKWIEAAAQARLEEAKVHREGLAQTQIQTTAIQQLSQQLQIAVPADGALTRASVADVGARVAALPKLITCPLPGCPIRQRPAEPGKDSSK
jgi:hypothetical protein